MALVTGGSRGIGLAVASELLRANASVVILSRSESSLSQGTSSLFDLHKDLPLKPIGKIATASHMKFASICDKRNGDDSNGTLTVPSSSSSHSFTQHIGAIVCDVADEAQITTAFQEVRRRIYLCLLPPMLSFLSS